MEKLDRCYKIVLQNSAKGISAVEVARKLAVHRTTAYGYLNSLELMGKVENEHGAWRAKTGEQTIKPLEKEVVIELPMPEKQWQRMAMLEALARDWEAADMPESANVYRISLEKLKETRTIKIKSKNVDDLNLEKLGILIQQAHEKSSKFNWKGLFKSLGK
ncbi:MAG: helix-turn-helix domain-containing protein [Candidatus Bathyarchaeota archaeon]|nr:helix-turn-helix domain-containing protein [Candidatus Bathyarchaeota archaeon]